MVEILMVMIIIAILFGLIVGVAFFAQRASLDAKTRASIEQIHNSLNEYFVKFYNYPVESGGSYTWKEAAAEYATGPISLDDAWGNPIQYNRIGAQEYELWSSGADEISGTPDDIFTGN